MKIIVVLLVAAVVVAGLIALSRFQFGLFSSGASGEPVNDLAAAWSPDGRKLVFDHPHDGDTEIYVLSDDGIKRLTDNNDSDYYPAWSPDGDRIAFLSDRRGHRAQLYVMNSDGSEQDRLTDADDGITGRPAWSWDSKRLGYTEFDCDVEYGRLCGGTIKIVELGTHRTTTIEKGNYYDMQDPSFARDGRLAFAGHDRFNLERIDVAAADGRRRRRVVGEPGSDRPTWSPDGRKIAYECGIAICLVNPDGTRKRFLRKPIARRPAWSPDGRRIVYACGGVAPWEPTSSKVGSLCVVSVAHGTSTRLRIAWSTAE